MRISDWSSDVCSSDLFNLPCSSWADYDAKLISKGGGIFPRSQKSIPLSAEVQALLGLSVSEIDPSSLISAILKAPVDLVRSEEHTSELQSLMRNSYADF